MKSSNDVNALNILGISQEEFDIVNEWCDNYDPDSSVGFEVGEHGLWVTNPFLDETGRFDLTIDEAIETYGLENVKKFCKQVLNYGGDTKLVDIDDDGSITTFYFYTTGSGYWFWNVDTAYIKEYPGTAEDFYKDPDNTNIGYSEAFFDTLQDAINNNTV